MERRKSSLLTLPCLMSMVLFFIIAETQATAPGGDDYVALATRLGVKRTTAWSVIKKYIQSGEVAASRRGGNRPKKVDGDMLDFCRMILEDNPTITLTKLNDHLREGMPGKPRVSIATLHRALHLSLITLKQIRNVPSTGNNPRNKSMRKSYAEWIFQTGFVTHRIYIDESGFNLYLSRSRGRSVAGERASRVVCGQRGRNMSLIMAISDQTGVLYHEIAWGGVNGDRIKEFLQNLSVILGEERVVVIMDNAPCHSSVQYVGDNPVKKLPPYSPFLNPIENCFSKIKFDVKQRLGQCHDLLDNEGAARAAGYSMKSWREHHLQQITEMAVDTVTQQDVAGYYNHSMTFLRRCLAEEDILDGS